MARQLRIHYEGSLYHMTLRGNERTAIVRDDEDRGRFVEALGASVLRQASKILDASAADSLPERP